MNRKTYRADRALLEVCTQLMQALGGSRVALISLDEFYRDLTPEECASPSDVNFDEPQAGQ